MLGAKLDRLRVTTEQWSTTGDDVEYSSIRSSKSEIDLGEQMRRLSEGVGGTSGI